MSSKTGELPLQRGRRPGQRESNHTARVHDAKTFGINRDVADPIARPEDAGRAKHSARHQPRNRVSPIAGRARGAQNGLDCICTRQRPQYPLGESGAMNRRITHPCSCEQPRPARLLTVFREGRAQDGDQLEPILTTPEVCPSRARDPPDSRRSLLAHIVAVGPDGPDVGQRVPRSVDERDPPSVRRPDRIKGVIVLVFFRIRASRAVGAGIRCRAPTPTVLCRRS